MRERPYTPEEVKKQIQSYHRLLDSIPDAFTKAAYRSYMRGYEDAKAGKQPEVSYLELWKRENGVVENG